MAENTVKNVGGRPKGKANQYKKADLDEMRDILLNHFDIFGKMLRVAEGYVPGIDDRGEKFERKCDPNQQIKAMQTLLNKTMPDLKATEVKGEIENNHKGGITVTVSRKD